MKKIDKLIISSFLGPFLLTFFIVVFILLNVQMLKYYDDLMGKGLSTDVLVQLFIYFGVFVTPTAFPLAVLLSSLMTFGSLGENFELTALKGAGISLVRAMLPIFVFVLFLTGIAFYSNNNLVPKAALEFYSLLYDIKQKKPAFDLKEGIFYQGIPNFSIKVNDKLDDGTTLKDVIIYDHREVSGNKKVTLADSGRMTTIMNDHYLKLELFNGNTYVEDNVIARSDRPQREETLTRSSFDKNEFVMDLSSFQLEKTDKQLFQSNRIMRNLRQLQGDVDSTQNELMRQRILLFKQKNGAFYYHSKEDSVVLPPDLARFKQWDDSVRRVRLARRRKARSDSILALGQNPHDSLNSPSQHYADRDESQAFRTNPQRDSDKTENKMSVPDTILGANSLNKSLADSGLTDPKTNQDSGRASLTKPMEKKLSDSVMEEKIENRITARKDVGKQTKDIVKSQLERKVLEDKKKVDGEKIIANLRTDSLTETVVTSALSLARQTKMKILGLKSQMDRIEEERDVFDIQWHKILSNAIACISMFLIGAPLGAIIKRGGLGVPVIVSIFFFILFYVVSMQGEKLAKQNDIEPFLGVWAANMVLVPIGLFFLRQARNDARLFDSDFYLVAIDKVKEWYRTNFKSKKK